MWIGVIVMIATMINWVRIMIPAPAASAHDHVLPDSTAAPEVSGRPVGLPAGDDRAAALLCASSRGSGLSRSQSTTAPDTYARTASMKGPARAGTPKLPATAPVSSTRLGPRIAPTAVAISTMLTARPRREG